MNCRLFVGNEYPVKEPQRKYGDSGIDFFVPEFTGEFIMEFEKKNPMIKHTDEAIILEPGEDVLIPLGVHSLFDPEWELRMSNKSGVCTKQKLIVGADVVDSTYEGVIHAHLFNNGKETAIIPYGQKIVQGCLEGIDPRPITVEKPRKDEEDPSNSYTLEDFYKEHHSERGAGGFGSTGV